LNVALEAEMERRSSLHMLIVVVLIALGFVALRPYFQQRLFVVAQPRTVEARGNLAEAERSTIELFERVSPSVVQVVGKGAAANDFSESDDTNVQTGTGFVWDNAGNIVTNNHVVEGTSALAVRLASGEAVGAEVVGATPNYDLAVIHLSGIASLPPPIALGTSSDLKVGQSAFAIGNPFGLDQSLTTGIISALKRRLPTSGGREIANVIQTDAAINPGNSGGPLLDSSGRLIGVNTAIYSPSGSNAGIGFAIPVDVVNRVVPQLIRDHRVPTPGIGIVAGSETVATRLGVEGVVIVRTVPGSPAERAGLRGVDMEKNRLGDVIVGVDGKQVHRLTDLTDELEQVGVGKKVQLTLNRNGNKTTADVEVADVGTRR
jgi:S1-C subfamily serine protease